MCCVLLCCVVLIDLTDNQLKNDTTLWVSEEQHKQHHTAVGYNRKQLFTGNVICQVFFIFFCINYSYSSGILSC